MTRPTAGVGTFDRRDDGAWDAFVAGADPGSYLQLSGWARVKAVNGWMSTRLLTGGAAPIGAQVLVRRPRPLPWAFAYAPRGPVAETWTGEAIEAFTSGPPQLLVLDITLADRDGKRAARRSAGSLSPPTRIGGHGSCTHLGTNTAPPKSKNSPWWSTAFPW